MSSFSALEHRCIFRTTEKSDTHALVARELADHYLKWRGDKVDARLCKLDAEDISLYSLKYGAGVEIYPATYQDFSLVHFSARRSIEVTADQKSHKVTEGRALLSSPRWNINLKYEPESEQLIVRIPHALTRRVAERLRRLALHDRLIHSSGALLTEAASEFWYSQLLGFVALDSACQQNGALSAWKKSYEEGLAQFLLFQFGSAEQNPAVSPKTEQMPARQRRARLVEFVQQNLDKPITLSEMAAVSALSERQLNVFCHEEFGQSPLRWLRGLRLSAVHASLLNDPGQRLSDVALQYGFSHFGRFSSYYHQRFGELPSQTLKAARFG